MTDGMGMIIESVVAVLLVFTIVYCVLLNRRLKMLRADEHALRATISELVSATEIAERAIGGLRVTARECDAGLGQRLTRAESICAELDSKLVAGKQVITDLSRIVRAGGRADGLASPQNAETIAAAAQAVANRVRNRVSGLAA